MSTKKQKIIDSLKKNKAVTAIICIYIFIGIAFINWGIPNTSHPFTYHMDEWHQSQAVRTVFTKGTPNIEGSANGSMLHFFLSGIYLIPFIILGILNPFAIKSSVANLEMQQRLFEIFRLNTLLFGVLSIVLLVYIAKKYFRLNTILVAFLFVFNPMWLSLSGYFKYDIALIFWILLALLFILKFIFNPNTKNYVIAGAISALSFSVKISAIPLLPVYIFVFFAYFPRPLKNIPKLFIGFFVYLVVFLVLGIPDLLVGTGDIFEYLDSNLRRAPASTATSFSFGMHYLNFMFFKLYPYTFGHVLYIVFFICIVFWIGWFFRSSLWKHLSTLKKTISSKREYVLFIVTFILFIISLVPLKLEARANRLLVLLPFIVLFVSLFITTLYNFIKTRKNKFIFTLLVVIFLLLQLFETFGLLWIKVAPDPRNTSSLWVQEHIQKETKIGVENIPIYQMLPDLALKEFYNNTYGLQEKGRFTYEVVNSKSVHLPRVVIVTGGETEVKYFKMSEKKDLLARLHKEKYKVIARFQPDFRFYRGDDITFYLLGLVISPTEITIFSK